MVDTLDDTQPNAPVSEEAVPVEMDESGGPGCVVWGLVATAGLGFSLLIVALAAAAGWTSGQRTAQSNATATQSANIVEQLNRIPGDIANGNLVLLQARIEYLATLTPGVPEVGGYAPTATALYLTAQPTATLLPTATAQSSEEATSEFEITPEGNGYDLAALMEQARTAVGQRNWDEAEALLDVMMALDEGYEAATVRSLMSQALNEHALELYQSGHLAEAIRLTDRAEEFGPLADGLAYEREAASLYLDAIRTMGTNYPAAIAALQRVYNLGQGRYYEEVTSLIVEQYVAYGDAWVGQGEYCPALLQYSAALSYTSDSNVVAKRDSAETACAQATPTPGPDALLLTPGTPGTPPPTQPIAPVGVIETPGT